MVNVPIDNRSPRGTRSGSSPQGPMEVRILKEIAGGVFWMVAGGVGVFILGLALSIGVVPVSFLVALVLLVAWADAMRSVRRRRAATVLMYLEQAVRLNLPLPQMLRAAAASETGVLRKRLLRLAECLEDGYPLGEAVGESAIEVPLRAVGLIASAESVGRVPTTLRRLVEEERVVAQRSNETEAFYKAYPVVMFVVLAAVLSMLLVVVVPKFRQIFLDFKTELPPVTKSLLTVAGTLDFWPLVLASLLFLGFSGRTLWRVLHARRQGASPYKGLTDRLIWWIPLIGTAARDRGLADVCHILYEAADAGRPMPQALAEARELEINSCLREQIRRWQAGVEQGGAVSDAARSAGLPKLLVGMLATVKGTADVAQVLQFLERYYGARFSRALLLLEGAWVPAVVLVMAVIVGWVILALFMPMITLINSLASAWRFM